MAGRLLTDDEVFGTAARKPTSKPAAGSGLLTDDEVFGTTPNQAYVARRQAAREPAPEPAPPQEDDRGLLRRGADAALGAVRTAASYGYVGARELANLEPTLERSSQAPARTFGESIRGGFNMADSMIYRFVEALGEQAGSKTVAGFGGREAQREDAEAAQLPERQRVSQVRTVGDLGQFVKDTVGEQIPVMGVGTAFAVGGAAAAPFVGGSTAVGGTIGAALGSFTLGAGEVQGAIKGKDPNAVAPGYAFVGGSAIAALDSVLPAKFGTALAKAVGLDAAEYVATKTLLRPLKEEMIRRGATGAVKGMATEALTEGVQEYIGEIAAAAGTGQEIDWKAATEQAFEAAAAGGVLGGFTGGATGAMEARNEARQRGPLGPTPETDRARAVGAQLVTPEDISSPLPTDLIAEGKGVVATAAEDMGANTILSGLGLPARGGRVQVQFPEMLNPTTGELMSPASTVGGTLDDAYEIEAGGLGKARGVKMTLDDGRTIDDLYDTLTGSGVQIGAEQAAQPVNPPEAEKAGNASDEFSASPVQVNAPPRDDEPVDQSQVTTAATGARNDKVKAQTAADLDVAVQQVQEPTEAQKEAGNYKKAHVQVQGLDITVETPKGATRSGTDPDGKAWSVEMPAHYGYVKRTVGADTEQVDVYVGPNPQAKQAFIVDQYDAETGKFDEHKVMLGFDSREEALAAYDAAFSDGRGPARRGAALGVPTAEMRDVFADPQIDWTQPFAPETRPGQMAVEGSQNAVGISSAPTSADTTEAVAQGLRDQIGDTGGRVEVVAVTGNVKTPIIRDSPSGKGLEVSGATDAQLKAIDAAGVPRPLPNRAGDLVYSKKHEAKIREALAERGPASGAPRQETRKSAVGTGFYQVNVGDFGTSVFYNPGDVRGVAQPGVQVAPPKQGRTQEDIDGLIDAVEGVAKRQGLHPYDPRLTAGDRLINPDKVAARTALNEGRSIEVRGRIYQVRERKKEPGTYVLFTRDTDSSVGFERAPVGYDRDGNFLAGNSRGAAVQEAMEEAFPDITSEPDTRPGAEPGQQETDDGRMRETEAEAAPEAEPVTEPAGAAPAPAPAANPSDWGAGNKLVSQDRAAELRKRLQDKLKNQVSAGIDPEIIAIGTELAVFHVEAGARRFADWARAMGRDLGMTVAELRPYLRSWYNGARDFMEDVGEPIGGMDGPDQVRDMLKTLVEQEQTDAAQPGQAETADRGRDEGAGAPDAPATEGVGQPGDGAEQPGGSGAADLRGDPERADVSGDAGAGGDAAGASRPAATGKAGGGARGARPGGRVRGPDGALDYSAPAGGLAREGGWKATAGRNLDIIELVERIEAENRAATPEEQAQLVKFTGWGASEMRQGLFPPGSDRMVDGVRSLVPRSWGDWKALSERAAEVLRGPALTSALQSTQYAHYTSEAVIRSIWAGVQRLGFQGGHIFEPGMGIGLFPVAAPGAVMEGSTYTGIELDQFTGKVAKLLLPNQKVIIGDFTKTAFPNGFFDLAIGNPPFANIQITSDPAYKRHRFSLHDYFFAKSLDKVRPGGLLVFVTSRYTMDKLDGKARAYMAEQADLLGAIRLPQTAFQQNAGTEVVTDVLFLRKRAPGEAPAGEPWLGMGEVKTKEGEKKLINQYFAKNPKMVLGEHALTGSMYRKDEYTVLPPEGDIEAAFAKAVARLPQGVYSGERATQSTQERVEQSYQRDFDVNGRKEGGVYVKDGKLFRVEQGAGLPLEASEKVSAKDEAWLKDYVGLRTAVKQAQLDQLQDGDWKASLAALQKTYRAFVKKHGPVSDFTSTERTKETAAEEGDAGAYRNAEGEWVTAETVVTRRFKNQRLLDMDIEGPLVGALERIDENDKVVEGAFLKDRTLNRPVVPEINGPQDAVLVSMDQLGRFDVNHVAQLSGVEVSDVVAALGDAIYEAPGAGWQTSDEYLSGDVRAKLEEAETAAAADPRFRRNVEALRNVQPAPLGAADITARLGAGWIPPRVVKRFASEILGLRGGVAYNPEIAHWTVEAAGGAGSRSNRDAGSDWGTSERGPAEILEAVLNFRKINVDIYVRDGSSKVKDQQASSTATAAANDKATKMRERFERWVWEDGKRAQDLVGLYNERFNNIAPRTFNGDHLTLPGLSLKYRLYPHQKRAIWRVIQTGNTYLAHAVGAGKTLEMIVSAMEQRRLGLVKKPMFVVPNHMLDQFAREFLDAYPAANIMVASEKSFHTDNRRRFMAQAALNDLDAIIVTHSSFGKISPSDESRQRVLNRLLGELQDAMDAMKGDDAAKHTRKKIENRIEQLTQRFEGKASKEGKDRTLDFDEMGVDMIYVDEAHEFRKLDYATQRQVKGIDPIGSQRSLDLFIKIQTLKLRNPGRSVVLASGTPVTNTMAELYTIQRYMDLEGLDRDGLGAFDAWAAMFGEEQTKLEPNAAGRYEMVTRFRKFTNVPELMKRVRSFMDVLTSSQLGHLVKRPDLKTGGPQLQITAVIPELREYMDGELSGRIATSRAWKPSKDQPNNPDPMIAIIGDARLASIDMRFMDPSLPSNPKSKLNQMIDQIIKTHAATAATTYPDQQRAGATQIVFSPLGFGEGVAANRGFSAKEWMLKRLAEAKIPRSDVLFMDDLDTHAKKEMAFKEMRAGTKRILVGSPKNMGTGVNVQSRLYGLHYLAPPWYPADVEQPHGRIIRQGNLNPEVEIFWYATKGTYDSTGWGMVSSKARMIEQAMTGTDVRSIDDISEVSQYDMASALAAGDERVIKMSELRSDVERLTRLQAQHQQDQWTLASEVRALDKSLPRYKEEAAALARAAEAVKALPDGYAFDIGGAAYDKPGEAGAAMLALAEAAAPDLKAQAMAGGAVERKIKAGTLSGNPVSLLLEMVPFGDRKGEVMVSAYVEVSGLPQEALVRADLEGLDATGLGQRLGNAMRRVVERATDARNRVRTTEARLQDLRPKAGRPFESQAELNDKTAELAKIEGELAAEAEAEKKAQDEARRQTQQPQAGTEQANLRRLPYAGAPNSLMGFSRDGSRQKGFGENRYPIELDVRVTMPDGEVFDDTIEGLNAGHALERARRNWDGATVEAVGESRKKAGREQATVTRTGDATGERSVEELAEIELAVSRRFREIGLSDQVGLRIVRVLRSMLTGERLEGADGAFFSGDVDGDTARVISVAYGAPDPVWTLNHEAIHALRNLGVFKPAEWRALEKAAEADQARMAEIRQRYPNDPPELQLEEAVADMFADWAAQRSHPRGLIGAAFERVRDVLEAIWSAVTAAGPSARRVMRDVDSGAVAGRASADPTPAERLNRRRPDAVQFDDAETEARWQDARRGVAGDPAAMVARAKDWFQWVLQGFARHYIDLPNDPSFADVGQQLRKLEAAPSRAKDELVLHLTEITRDMDAADLDLFTRKVVLDDLAWEASVDHELPFGLTPDTLAAERAKVDAAVSADPKIRDAVRKRKLLVQRVTSQLVDSGVLSAEQVRNPAYYRHQVLEYARAQERAAAANPKKLKAPKWARREGSQLDINANFLEAESDWLLKAMTDIVAAKTIEWIKRSDHNIRGDLIKQARDHNKAALDEALAQDMRENGYTKSNGKQTSPLKEQMSKISQRHVVGLGFIRTALEAGEIDVPARFQKIADAIEADTASEDSIFPFMEWILETEAAGVQGAGMIMKAAAMRREFMRRVLGKDYANPLDIEGLIRRFAPEGYVSWQPDEGKLLFTAKTLPEHVIDAMLLKLAAEGTEGMSQEEIRSALNELKDMLVIGGDRFKLVIPEELAATLNGLRDVHVDGIVDWFTSRPLSLWKQWMLLNPRNALKYNLNNMSGDLDAVIAGNPQALRRMPEAIRELWRVQIKGLQPTSPRYREAVERGVFDSGLSIQEIPDINSLSRFERLVEQPATPAGRAVRFALTPFAKVWNALRDFTQFRENWVRFAAYLDYADRIEAGETLEQIGYGASVPKMLAEVTDPKDRAALMARDLVGDYGNISYWGNDLRRRWIPFWSWLEINTKRYNRLFTNAYAQGIGPALRTSTIIGVGMGARTSLWLLVRIGLVYGALQLWNNLLFGDEEDELPEEERVRMHLILGRDDEGNIRTMRLQGALSDYLAWFGLEDAIGAAVAVEKGRATPADVAQEVGAAPVNKLVNGLTPVLKVPMELGTGKKLWPDVFNARPIRDRWRHLASTFKFEHEYDAIMGKPSRGYLASLGAVSPVSARDRGEAAYNRIRGLMFDWKQEVKGDRGAGGHDTPSSRALYNWRQAKRFRDLKAEQRAVARLNELGVKGQSRRDSIRSAHPLGDLSKRDRAQFIRTLDPDEREALDQASAWYREVYLDQPAGAE